MFTDAGDHVVLLWTFSGMNSSLLVNLHFFPGGPTRMAVKLHRGRQGTGGVMVKFAIGCPVLGTDGVGHVDGVKFHAVVRALSSCGLARENFPAQFLGKR